jgi:hypothetical protein
MNVVTQIVVTFISSGIGAGVVTGIQTQQACLSTLFNLTVDNIFELPIMALLTGRLFDDVVLLNHGKDVAPELSHLAVIILDHLRASGNV